MWQWLTSSSVLNMHIPEQTNLFILYIRVIVLLSEVKIFNLLFKSKFQSTQGTVDLFDMSAFTCFKSMILSFPGHLMVPWDISV